MALATDSVNVHGILPDEISALIVQPVARNSAAMEASTVVDTGVHEYRIPIVAADPAAAWVPEGGEITASDAALDELVVEFNKLAGLSIISRELAEDSSPQAQEIVGAGLARDIARKLDSAFFGSTTTNGPDGLLSLTGVQSVDTGGTITNVDPFAEALSKAENVGAEINTFIAHPDTVLALAKLKTGTGLNTPLLGNDPSAPTKRVIQGVPLVSSPAVAAGDIWGIPRDRVHIVLRQDVTLDVDHSVYFTSDRVAVRATMRVGFGFVHEAAIVRIHDAV
ncbi:phage major capsid protein [Rhodococcus sp. AH-ZY2]|uniref:phage major capsid protein n=1 Tax=Rhodococcus sp. AH-ZY2 TaxID=3047468 RepID=UPI0027DED776|nr:phage major capsid protein [Rhodococcus sp. AH-ZY2]WML64764.1 phage major capsid protein [Rhodococcus sp. AH-ZY2]